MEINQQEVKQLSASKIDKHRFVKIDFKSEPNFEKNTRNHPLRKSGAINRDGVLDLDKVSLRDINQMLKNTDGYTSDTFLTLQVSIAKLEQNAQNSGAKFLSTGLDVKIDGVLALKQNGKFINPREIRNKYCNGSFAGIAKGGVSKKCLDKLSSFAIAVADIQENQFGAKGNQVDGVPGKNFIRNFTGLVDERIKVASKIKNKSPVLVASDQTVEQTATPVVVAQVAVEQENIPKEVTKAEILKEIPSSFKGSSKLPQLPDVSKLAIGGDGGKDLQAVRVLNTSEKIQSVEAGLINVAGKVAEQVPEESTEGKISSPRQKAFSTLRQAPARDVLNPEKLKGLTNDMDALADGIKGFTAVPYKLRHSGFIINQIVESLPDSQRLTLDSKFKKGLARFVRSNKAGRKYSRSIESYMNNSRRSSTLVNNEFPVVDEQRINSLGGLEKSRMPERAVIANNVTQEIQAVEITKPLSLPASDLPYAQLTKELKATFSKPFDGVSNGQAVLDLVTAISERKGALSLINAGFNKRVGRTPVSANKNLLNVLEKNQVSPEVLERISTLIKEDKAEITKYQKNQSPVNARLRRSS